MSRMLDVTSSFFMAAFWVLVVVGTLTFGADAVADEPLTAAACACGTACSKDTDGLCVNSCSECTPNTCTCNIQQCDCKPG
jgi:hypothetical protein